jgi:hypothetical protein
VPWVRFRARPCASLCTLLHPSGRPLPPPPHAFFQGVAFLVAGRRFVLAGPVPSPIASFRATCEGEGAMLLLITQLLSVKTLEGCSFQDINFPEVSCFLRFGQGGPRPCSRIAQNRWGTEANLITYSITLTIWVRRLTIWIRRLTAADVAGAQSFAARLTDSNLQGCYLVE